MENKDTYSKGVAKDQEKHTGEQGEFFTFDGSDNLGVTDMFIDDGFDIIHQHAGEVHLSDLSPEEQETAIPKGSKKVKKIELKPRLDKEPFNISLIEASKKQPKTFRDIPNMNDDKLNIPKEKFLEYLNTYYREKLIKELSSIVHCINYNCYEGWKDDPDNEWDEGHDDGDGDEMAQQYCNECGEELADELQKVDNQIIKLGLVKSGVDEFTGVPSERRRNDYPIRHILEKPFPHSYNEWLEGVYKEIEPRSYINDYEDLDIYPSDTINLSESLRQTENINPELMIGDEILVVSTEGIHDFGEPELYKPYVVVGIKYSHNASDPHRKDNRPDYDKPFYQIEPVGMTDEERTGAMLAGGGRMKPLYIFSPADGHSGSDHWILRPEFLRGELNESAPKPGSSSAEGFDDKGLPYETEYLTLDEILSRVKNIAYYKEVLRDLQDDKDNWEVTNTVKRYANYWMENPDSLTGPDFPPIQVIGDGMKDGSHRISTLNALANHIDADNPYWKNVKLEVRFYDPEIVMESGHFYPWLWDISDTDLQQAIDDKVYNWEVLEKWLADPNAKSDLKKLRGESITEQIETGINPELEVGDVIRVLDVDGEHARMPHRWGIYKVQDVKQDNATQEFYYDIVPYPEIELPDRTPFSAWKTAQVHSDQYWYRHGKTLYRGDKWIYADVDRKTISESLRGIEKVNPPLMVGDEILVVDNSGTPRVNLPELYRPYVVEFVHKPNKYQPSDAQPHYSLDLLDPPDLETAVAQDIRIKDLKLYQQHRWIFRPGFLRGELNESLRQTQGLNPELEVGDIIRVIDINREVESNTLEYNIPSPEVRPEMFVSYEVVDKESNGRYSKWPWRYTLVPEGEIWTTGRNPQGEKTTNEKLLYPWIYQWIYADTPMATKVDRKTISEDDGDVNDMVYIDEPREKHIKRMGKDLGVFDNFPINNFMNIPPPENESDTTEDEIEHIEEIPVDNKFVDTTDNIHIHFKRFLKSKNLEYPEDEIEEILSSIGIIILKLKYHYNRPRPQQVAAAKELELNPTTLDSASTPSYPSGHATQGRFIARYLSEIYPDYHDELIRVGDEIGDGRLMAKVHYPSDQAFGKSLGDKLYNYYYSTNVDRKTISEQEEPDIGEDGEEHGTFTRKDIIILNYISQHYTKEELMETWEDTNHWGDAVKKWDNVMKLFSIPTDAPENQTISTKYARWAWENWDKAKEYDMDFGKIPNPIKTTLKWYDVDMDETGTQVEYKSGNAEILGFDEDNVETRAEDDFYGWGGEMETHDWGDYETHDHEVVRTDFIRIEESTRDPKKIQEILFTLWRKMGPTLDSDTLKLVGFNMNSEEDKIIVYNNLMEYYGDEELRDVAHERLEGIHHADYEFIVSSYSSLKPPAYEPPKEDALGLETYVDVIINGDQTVPIGQEDGTVIEMTMWEANEMAAKAQQENPYEDAYEDVREEVWYYLNDVILKNLPVDAILDYVDFSEPGTFEAYNRTEMSEDLKNWSYDDEEIGVLEEQVMMKSGDMLKLDIFKFLSNRFTLEQSEYGEIKDNNNNYYRLIDMEEPNDHVTLSHLINPVVEFVDYGIKSGTFEYEDIQQGIKAITDWISLEMNQKKELPN